MRNTLQQMRAITTNTITTVDESSVDDGEVEKESVIQRVP